MKGMKAAAPKTPMPSAPKIHPAAQRARIRMPGAENVGADTGPVLPNVGKIV